MYKIHELIFNSLRNSVINNDTRFISYNSQRKIYKLNIRRNNIDFFFGSTKTIENAKELKKNIFEHFRNNFNSEIEIVQKYCLGLINKKIIKIDDVYFNYYMMLLGYNNKDYLYTNLGPIEKNDKEFFKLIHEDYLKGILFVVLENKYGMSKTTIRRKFHEFKFEFLDSKIQREKSGVNCRNIFFEKYKQKIFDSLNNNGYRILEEYSGMKKNYTFEHINCGTIFIRYFLNINKKIKCPKCFPLTSHYQLELDKLIKDLGYKTELNNISKIRNENDHKLELDIFIPKEKIAFEINSIKFHSIIKEWKDRNYHKYKTDECLKQGIKLYHVWYYHDEKIIKSKIKLLLNNVENKIGARKLKIKQITNKECKEFYNENHLFGYIKSSFNLGLIDNDDKIISCISFKLNKNKIEISRFCTLKNYSVVGGFSKLFKHSLKYIKEKYPDIKTIYTYIDKDWSPDYKDSVYYKNNFKFICDTGSQLLYAHDGRNEIISRQILQKHKLKELYPEVYDDNLTAHEILEKKNIYPIYNSGNWKMEYQI